MQTTSRLNDVVILAVSLTGIVRETMERLRFDSGLTVASRTTVETIKAAVDRTGCDMVIGTWTPELKATAASLEAPVVAVVPQVTSEIQQDCYYSGVVGVIGQDDAETTTRAFIRSLLAFKLKSDQKEATAGRQALRDRDTGLWNDMQFRILLDQKLREAARALHVMAVARGARELSLPSRIGVLLVKVPDVSSRFDGITGALNASVRGSDMIFRLGPELFAVIASPGHRAALDQVRDRFLSRFSGDHVRDLGFRFGKAIYPDNADTVDQLVDAAEVDLARQDSGRVNAIGAV